MTTACCDDVAAAGLLRPPPSRTRLVLSFATLVVLLAVTLFGVWVDATIGHWRAVPYVVVFAVLFGLIIVHGVLLFWAPQRRRGRPRTTEIAGRAYTVLPNAGGLFAVVTGVAVCLAALPALIVVGAVGGGRPGPVVFWSAIALVFGSYLVDVATGRLAVGYVALGPDRVRQRGRSFESFLPWDSVHRVLRVHVDVPTVIVSGYPDGVWERRRTSLWRIDRLPSMVTMDVDAGISALPPALVLDVIAFYVAHPEARHELGTPAAIARFADWPQ